MVTLGKYAARFANAALGLLDAKVVAGNVTRPISHPQRPELLYRRVFPTATYSPWLSDVEFMRCYSRIREYTLVDIYRCHELWTLACQLAVIQGNFLEVGVWRGGTGCLIAEAVRDSGKTVYLADTFSGVVKAGKFDRMYTGGEHADTSEATVHHLITRLELGNAVVIKGVFPEDTASKVDGSLAFIHCDVDVYQSAKDIMEWAIPKLTSGAVVVFDDYGFENCEGVTILVNELRFDSRFLILHNLNGHAILMRR